jgi:hypothetical protein
MYNSGKWQLENERALSGQSVHSYIFKSLTEGARINGASRLGPSYLKETRSGYVFK